MTAANHNITAEQGATFSKVLTLSDSNENLINLNGYTARMHVRASYAATVALAELTTENGGITLGGVAGTITLLISAATMAGISVVDTPGTPPTRVAVYDLEIIDGSGVVTRLLQGKFTITREVTR